MMNETGLDGGLLRGLVLAGGEGRRLQSYVQQLRGEALPKQYVNFVGRRSMLEHTFHRAEKLIPAEQIFTVVSRQHLAHAEVRRQLATRPQRDPYRATSQQGNRTGNLASADVHLQALS